jgi:hypothetical protein
MAAKCRAETPMGCNWALADLWLEVRIGDKKRFATQRSVGLDMLSAARVDDLRKEIVAMAEDLADLWEWKSGAADTVLTDARTMLAKARAAGGFDPNG